MIAAHKNELVSVPLAQYEEMRRKELMHGDLVIALGRLVDRIDYYASIANTGGPNIEDWAYTLASSDVEIARTALARAGAQ